MKNVISTGSYKDKFSGVSQAPFLAPDITPEKLEKARARNGFRQKKDTKRSKRSLMKMIEKMAHVHRIGVQSMQEHFVTFGGVISLRSWKRAARLVNPDTGETKRGAMLAMVWGNIGLVRPPELEGGKWFDIHKALVDLEAFS